MLFYDEVQMQVTKTIQKSPFAFVLDYCLDPLLFQTRH